MGKTYKVKFVGKAIRAMRIAIEFAISDEKIKDSRYKEYRGELYMQIPEEELDLWIDLMNYLEYDDKEHPQFRFVYRKIGEDLGGMLEEVTDEGKVKHEDEEITHGIFSGEGDDDANMGKNPDSEGDSTEGASGGTKQAKNLYGLFR